MYLYYLLKNKKIKLNSHEVSQKNLSFGIDFNYRTQRLIYIYKINKHNISGVHTYSESRSIILYEEYVCMYIIYINKLKLNENKTKLMTINMPCNSSFRINNVIEMVNSINYLGFIIDLNLKIMEHLGFFFIFYKVNGYPNTRYI